MAFYDLQKQDRASIAGKISNQILQKLQGQQFILTEKYFSDEATYIRKTATYPSLQQIFGFFCSLVFLQKAFIHSE